MVLDLHDTADLYVLDFLMVDMARDLHVADMEYMFEYISIAGCDQLHDLHVKHYVQFVPGSEHVDWW